MFLLSSSAGLERYDLVEGSQPSLQNRSDNLHNFTIDDHSNNQKQSLLLFHPILATQIPEYFLKNSSKMRMEDKYQSFGRTFQTVKSM